MSFLKQADPAVFEAVREETLRQSGGLELIASENFVSRAVLEAAGSVLTNKYAEGYPGKRYYGGCRHVDTVEQLAIERAKRLFGAEHANVQPHSGSQANMAVYFSVLQPGETLLAMNLDHGGHLTHGSPVNFSGRLYRVVSYGVQKESGRIDYDQVAALAREHRPKLIMVGASAYPRTIDFVRFREAADQVGALVVADIAHIAGLVATGLHPSPVPVCEFVTTTTHKTLRGPRGGMVLCREAQSKELNSRVFPGMQGGPLMHIIAAKAVALGEALAPEFAGYQRRIVENARALAETLLGRGFGLVSGGTDNHLMLIDLAPRGQTGKECERLLEEAGITVNKNMVPFDQKGPFVTSGIRIGTPAVTTRGMGESEMRLIGGLIADVLDHPGEAAVTERVRGTVTELCAGFPLYRDLPGD